MIQAESFSFTRVKSSGKLLGNQVTINTTQDSLKSQGNGEFPDTIVTTNKRF